MTHLEKDRLFDDIPRNAAKSRGFFEGLKDNLFLVADSSRQSDLESRIYSLFAIAQHHL